MSRTAPNVRIKNSTDAIIETFARPLDEYEISDKDESSSTKYYGYLAVDGAWYIMKVTSTEIRYSKGTTSYTTNWTGRVSLTYDTLDNIF